ncbi:MAG: DEAD/DEAH box helicase [Planctomycetes bacterium]|nr:DEAD/DEAH box helicase [Planctomycetota bacterium]
MTFDDLRLEKPFLDAVRAAGYETPTPIQAKAIPLILDGHDVVACAQTGTGKTAAFALPILQRLSDPRSQQRTNGHRSRTRHIRTLVLAPTRELAQQIADSFATYGRSCGLKHTVVYGGVNKNPQIRALRAGVDILVATPGRLLDHMADGVIRLNAVEVLVLDEADRMLDMGFMPDIRRILKVVPEQRQTLLLSATMPAPIRKLADDILRNPVSVEVSRISAPAETVEHWAYRVEKKEKPSLLCNFLQNTPYSRALVFTRTKHGADKVVRHLTKSGVAAAAIHGNKSQNARTRALAGFKAGTTAVLVATDIAARGLDIDDISHVINYDLTNEPETYVHRIGRTGRAGATGTALSFVSSEDQGSLRDIERLIRTQLQPAADLPGYVAPKVILEPTNGDKRQNSQRNGDNGRHRPRPAAKNGSRSRPRRNRGGNRSAAASR